MKAKTAQTKERRSEKRKCGVGGKRARRSKEKAGEEEKTSILLGFKDGEKEKVKRGGAFDKISSIE